MHACFLDVIWCYVNLYKGSVKELFKVSQLSPVPDVLGLRLAGMMVEGARGHPQL